MAKPDYELTFRKSYKWTITILVTIVLVIVMQVISLEVYWIIAVWIVMGIISAYQISMQMRLLRFNKNNVKALKIHDGMLEINKHAFKTYKNDLLINTSSIVDAKIIMIKKKFLVYGIGLTFSHKKETVNIVISDVFNEPLDKVHEYIRDIAISSNKEL